MRECVIAPDNHLCPQCGEDLQHLLLPQTVADHFQARAHDFSERGEFGAALVEAERGLTYADSSELRLLAAILAKQVGRHDRMRHHVSAIPVDDSLRGEAEWLLRSHQDRERALQEVVRHTQSQQGTGLSTNPTAGAAFLEELLGSSASQPIKPNKRNQGQLVASGALIAVAVVIVVASWWWIGPGALPRQEASSPSSSEQALLGDGDAAGQGSTLTASATSVAAPSMPTTSAPPTAIQPTATSAEAVATAVILLPTPTPSPAIPDNLVQAETETPELADSNPNRAVVIVSANGFDLQQYLRELGYTQLAELKIDARIQGQTLVLTGFVHLDAQRRELIEIARSVPGVRDVNSVDLLLRPLPTYVVQQGDTLWSVVYKIYGSADRLDEFAAHNRDILPSPDALAPGMELKVLPVP